MSPVLFVYDLLCRHRSICHIDTLPIRSIKEILALHKSLWMGIYLLYIRKPCPRNPKQGMSNMYLVFSHHSKVALSNHIIYSVYEAGRGILYWKNPIIRLSTVYNIYYILKCFHIYIFYIVTKELEHCLMAVGSGNSLICHHRVFIYVQSLHALKVRSPGKLLRILCKYIAAGGCYLRHDIFSDL